jgi:capsular exopolysaccharide synthesis family protein
MSRIQDILSKAERDGTVRRTRSLTEDYARPAEDSRSGRPGRDDVSRSATVASADRVYPSAAEGSRMFRTPRPEGAASIAPLSPRTGYTERSTSEALPGEHASGTEPLHPAQAQLDPLLVAAHAPSSLAAEQYRSLRTRLKHVENGRALRTIAITSPAKGDGKSLTAANLALTLAQEFQQRVLLLDADLRRPTVHRLFGVEQCPGLGDVLMNAADLDQALVAVQDHHLTVLPAGIPPGNPAELLGSAAMRRVLDTLRSRFDRILIDVPPVAPLADLHILAPVVDGLLLIVRAGITPKPAIERALSGLDTSKVLGLVLNEVGSHGNDAYNYDGYGYLAG